MARSKLGLFGLEAGIALQIAIIIVATAIALISVLRGLDGGVELLSSINSTSC